MQLTREIYWNVGHGVVLPMYLFALAAFGLFFRGYLRRLPVYRLGRGANRLDRLRSRLLLLIRTTLTQGRLLLVPSPGSLHALFFWGFLLLFIGTLLIMVQVDVTEPLFRVRFLQGTFYTWFSLVLDLAGLVAILMLGGLLVRRFVVRPPGLATIGDDYVIYLLLFTILVTGFVVEGLRMAVTEIGINPELAPWSPVGLLVGELFAGSSPAGLRLAHRLLWWVHFFLAMGFIAAIPVTKLRHIFTTSVNYLFSDLGPKGGIATIDLEEEGREQFGAARVTDLTWKDIFDADACTACKRCQDRCPAWATEKPLSPMTVVQQIGQVAFDDPSRPLCPVVTPEVLWACTTCRACQEICPANIEQVNKILEMRRNLSLMEGAFPGDEVRSATTNLEVNGNPFGLAFATRGDWAEGLPVTLPERGGEADILYFVGCFASFDRRNREVARAFVRICASAGIRVGILGKGETCCGEPARKLGNEYLYQTVAKENIRLINGYGVKRIVTTCPHCFNTLARDYRDLGLDLPVEHHTTFVHDLLRKGAIKLTAAPEPFQAAYHDSCYIGRYMDIYDEPRWIIRQAGGRIREMAAAGPDSFCCGGGGGRIVAEERIGTRISETRVAMARATGAPLLVSNCPFCLTMFEDGLKTGGLEGTITVRDLAEIVAERLPPPDLPVAGDGRPSTTT